MNGFVIASVVLLEVMGIITIILCAKWKLWETPSIVFSEKWMKFISGKSALIDANIKLANKILPSTEPRSRFMRDLYKFTLIFLGGMSIFMGFAITVAYIAKQGPQTR